MRFEFTKPVKWVRVSIIFKSSVSTSLWLLPGSALTALMPRQGVGQYFIVCFRLVFPSVSIYCLLPTFFPRSDFVETTAKILR